ncbi:MAG: hypothetical protein ACXWRE_11455 [Pseudobdellovibrionaceae bacterium]
MTYKKIILASSLILLISACGKVTGLKTQGTDTIPKDVLEKARSQFCNQDQVLTEIPDAIDTPFSNLTLRSTIFAFTTPKDLDCITKTNINETWAENGANFRFNLNINSTCLKNNSIWRVVGSQTSGFDQYYDLESVGDSDLPPRLQMNAHQAVRGTYVRDRVGLRILGCSNNN